MMQLTAFQAARRAALGIVLVYSVASLATPALGGGHKKHSGQLYAGVPVQLYAAVPAATVAAAPVVAASPVYSMQLVPMTAQVSSSPAPVSAAPAPVTVYSALAPTVQVYHYTLTAATPKEPDVVPDVPVSASPPPTSSDQAPKTQPATTTPATTQMVPVQLFLLKPHHCSIFCHH